MEEKWVKVKFVHIFTWFSPGWHNFVRCSAVLGFWNYILIVQTFNKTDCKSETNETISIQCSTENTGARKEQLFVFFNLGQDLWLSF